jgi:hypothetical protein
MWSDLNLPPINLWTVPYLEIKSAKHRAVHKPRDIALDSAKLENLKKIFNNRVNK